MQIVINDLLASYTKSGSGPVVVLLHGWGDSLSTFRSLEKSLSSNYTVLSVDLPGFGNTEKPRNPFTLADYADFVSTVLEKTQCKKVYAYIGHSNGGAIAIKGLSTKKLSSEKLVLLASAGIRSKGTLKQNVYTIIAKLVKLPLHLLPKDTRDRTRKKVYGFIGSDLFVAEGMEDTFKNVVSEDLLISAGAITADTLLLYGSEDKATPPLFGQKYAEAIEHSKMHIIEHAGHFVHLEKPDQVQLAIKEFLDS